MHAPAAPDESADEQLDAALRHIALPVDAHSIANAVRALVLNVPTPAPPGAGATLERWRLLAALAGRDLSLVKIYEAHADALAILAELGAARLARHDGASIWAVWAARNPANEARVTSGNAMRVTLAGVKPWCSGAPFVTDALITCIDANGHDRLAALPLDQPGVVVTSRGWEAVGMRATQSVEIELNGAEATLVGGAGDYVARPGFWQGGAGIAACWYGAAVALAERLRDTAAPREHGEPPRDEHAWARALEQAGKRAWSNAHLGTVDAALVSARALLRECALAIDTAPHADAMRLALRARAVAETAVDTTLRACARALGAAPLCRDRWFARMASDLPVFVRQSHAEGDLAALGASHGQHPGDWRL